jgi:hypothetical protein
VLFFNYLSLFFCYQFPLSEVDIFLGYLVPVFSVADPDPGSGPFLTPGSGMGKNSRFGSGMNLPDHIYESLEIIFCVKILKFFEAVPDSDPGPGINIIDPQHCRVSICTVRYRAPSPLSYSGKNGIFDDILTKSFNLQFSFKSHKITANPFANRDSVILFNEKYSLSPLCI